LENKKISKNSFAQFALGLLESQYSARNAKAFFAKSASKSCKNAQKDVKIQNRNK